MEMAPVLGGRRYHLLWKVVMQRQTEKKVVKKKKTATKFAPQKKNSQKKPQKKPQKKSQRKTTQSQKRNGTADFDTWAKSQADHRAGCWLCREQEAANTIRKLLSAMERNRAHRTPIAEIRKMVEQQHPNVAVGHRSLERHLCNCERDRYFRARGKTNG